MKQSTDKIKIVKKNIFSILIPSWNNLAYLQLCVASIRKNSIFPHQIIVHVNEGSDGTLDWLRRQPDVVFTASATNVGVCEALNQCALLATCDYLLYINDDMYVCPEWDEVLYEEIKAIGHDQFFLSATAIEPVPQSTCSIGADFGRSPETFEEDRLLREYSTFTKSDWQGATWPPNVVPRRLWHLVGGYSIEFSPGMYSDPDFSMKLWRAGVRYFKGMGRSRVYHFGSVSVKRIVKNQGYYTFIGKWGMTSSTFSRYYLRRGNSWDGPLQVLPRPALIRLKNLFKRFRAVFANG